MSLTIVNRRGRSLAALTGIAGLVLGAASIVSAPAAQSAPPADDCKTAFPVADLHRDDPVTAMSVTQGTTPQSFAGSVIGVLNDGIAPDVPMVMVDFTPTGPDPDRIGGIWQGMSGSPVYTSDGRLLGAVAYGLAYGPSWIAGVTPFEDMDNYLTAGAASKSVKVTAVQARAIAGRTDVTASQASQGFSQIRMPLGVSGLSGKRLDAAESHRAGHKWMPKGSYAMGPAAAPGDPSAPGAESIIAGGNLAATLSYGDVTQGGVGTATSVCNGRVVGFGHPLAFLGTTSESIHPADALYIQADPLGAPFKVANLGAPVGTITDDHQTGITGTFGALPTATDVTSDVSYGTRQRTGASHVTVPTADALASTTFFELITNHDRVIDGVRKGSELQTWTINGHEDDGTPFELSVTNRFVSNYDITFDSAYQLADFVYSLTGIQGVTVDGVDVTSAVDDDNSVWRVSMIQQRQHGAWVTLGRHDRAVAHAGKNLVLRTVLVGASGSTRNVLIPMAIPQKAAGARGEVDVTGGNYLYSEDGYPQSLGQAKRFAEKLVRNDELKVDLGLFGPMGRVVGTKTFGPVDHVVNGQRAIRVVVK